MTQHEKEPPLAKERTYSQLWARRSKIANKMTELQKEFDDITENLRLALKDQEA